MKNQFTQSQQRFLFLLGITSIYLLIIFYLDFLRGPYWWDEETFWSTSLSFSERIIPSLDDIRNYEELNTPLPFIVFGALENLFGQGIVAGRLFNLLLSVAMVFIIGWPTKEKGAKGLLCLAGLLLCPYYLWLSGRLYTEMIACFLLLMGLVGYVRNRPWWSCLAFVLAISSRQYMVAFPAAIATYELIIATLTIRQTGCIDWRAQRRWMLPSLAAGSIFLWFYLFQGLAPEIAYDVRLAPDVQKTAWSVEPGGAIHYLAFVGLYIVMPEFLLFQPRAKIAAFKQLWPQQKHKVTAIALGLLVFVMLFPPQAFASGNLAKVANAMPHEVLQVGIYYGLALLTCLRFSTPNLIALMVLFNALIMMKAHPWDRYILPLVIAFWYLKSMGLVDQFLIFPKQSSGDTESTDLLTAGSP